MTTTITGSEAATLAPTTVRGIGAAVGLVAACLTTLFAHDWPEVISMVALVVVVTGLVFGYALPRSLPRGGSGRWALGYAVVAALLVVPAFWSGVPFVLGVAAVIEGNAGRTARSGAGASIAAVVLGALTSLFYLAIYVDGKHRRPHRLPALLRSLAAVLRQTLRRTAVTLPRMVAWVPSMGS